MAFKMKGAPYKKSASKNKSKKSKWSTPGTWQYNLKQTFSDIKGKATSPRYYK